MTGSGPEPLTPPDCDLRGLQFMSLDVQRLRDSDLALLSSGDGFKAAVLLWCASWHQIPAASLPKDEGVLRRLSGLEPRPWRAVRDTALRGWIECSDGRLYHPVVAEKAAEAWRQRLRYRARREADRDRLRDWRDRGRTAGQRGDGDKDAAETLGETASETRFETPKRGRGRGTGRKEDSAPTGALSGKPDAIIVKRADVEGIWRATPHKGRERSSKADLERALKAAAKRGHTPATIAAALAAYYASADATKAGGEFAKGVHRQIEADRWQTWAEGGAGTDVTGWGDAEWAQAMRLWREERLWSADMGSQPGEPGCLVPTHLLVEAVA